MRECVSLIVRSRSESRPTSFLEPEDAWLDSEDVTYFRFMVPMHAQKRKGAPHEPALPLCKLLLHMQQKFVIAVHNPNARPELEVEATHEPCSADIPVRGFTGHSCPVSRNRTGPCGRADWRLESRQNPQTGMSALLRRRFTVTQRPGPALISTSALANLRRVFWIGRTDVRSN